MADIVDKPADPYTAECIVVGVGSAAVGFTPGCLYQIVASGPRARVAFAGCETTSVRFHISGLTPAANSGMLWADGDYMLLDSPSSLSSFLVVCTGGTATLYVTFYQ